jgi:peroxiredoxin
MEADRAEINQRAREEVEFLKEAATLSRSIADKAAQAQTGRVEEKYRRYFDLIAQHNRKYAEMLDVIREQAELLLGSEPNETIVSKRAKAQKLIEALRQEADYLHQQAEKLVR